MKVVLNQIDPVMLIMILMLILILRAFLFHYTFSFRQQVVPFTRKNRVIVLEGTRS